MTSDPSQGTAQGVNPNNNILLDAQHHGSKQITHNQIHSRFLNNDFPSSFMYNNAQSVNTNIKSGRERVGNPEHSNVYVCWPQQCVFIGADSRRVEYEIVKQVSRELFPADLADENSTIPDESNNRTSTPNTEGIVNVIIPPIVGSLVTSNVHQTTACISNVEVHTIPPPSAS